MKRGRPRNSRVRQNIIELLAQFGELHGYELYKHYVEVFPKVSMRATYYSLRNGVRSGHFRIARVERQQGCYSWGPEARRIYYGLGKEASPVGNAAVRQHCRNVMKSRELQEKTGRTSHQ